MNRLFIDFSKFLRILVYHLDFTGLCYFSAIVIYFDVFFHESLDILNILLYIYFLQPNDHLMDAQKCLNLTNCHMTVLLYQFMDGITVFWDQN